MIQLTRLNHVPLILNSDLIEHIEMTADTVITLTTGQRFLVLESPDEVVEKVIAFRKAILAGARCVYQDHSALPIDQAEVTQTHGG